jgi:hypothetical protein
MVDRQEERKTMKLGFTGTRSKATNFQLEGLVSLLEQAEEFHHGDCVGADEAAHDLALKMNVPVVIHPPTNSKYRAFTTGWQKLMLPAPYLVRNREIVRETDLLVAFPKSGEEEIRSGTWATVRYARELGKNVVIIFPDGRVREEKE